MVTQPVRRDQFIGAVQTDTGIPLAHRIRSLFRALTDAGVQWCLLRGEIDDVLVDGDVDLLVQRADADLAAEIYAMFGFLPAPDWDVPTHHHYIAYDGSSGRWLTLDIVTELAYGPGFTIRTRAADGVLARCRWEDGIPRPALDDEFWTLLWHCLLDKVSIKPVHARRLHELVQTAHQTNYLARTFARMLPSSWRVDDVVSAIEHGQFDSLEALARRLQRRAGRRSITRRVTQYVRSAAQRVAFRATRPGVVVALLAPDGAGKSTLSEGIKREFAFPVHVTWLGIRKTADIPATIFGLPIPGIVLIRRLTKVWGAYLRGARHRALGRLVIFDRYTYDQSFVLKEAISNREWLFYALITRSLPAPDRVFVLDLPGQAMFDRKGEHSPDYLELQRQRFLSTAAELPNAIIVDATQDADTVRRVVMDEIWRTYVERWTGVRDVHPVMHSASKSRA